MGNQFNAHVCSPRRLYTYEINWQRKRKKQKWRLTAIPDKQYCRNDEISGEGKQGK